MNINIKFFKIKKDFKKKSYVINFNFYWKIILFLCLIILLLSFGFSFNLFMKIAKESDLIIEQDNNKIEITQKERIKNVLEYFTEREKKSQEIINSSPPIIDPSL